MKTKLLVLIALLSTSATAGLINGAGEYTLTLIEESAGYRDSNILSAYEIGNPASLTQIFAGPDSPGAVTVIDMAVPWGYLLDSPDGLFYSEPALNSDTPVFQHFIVEVPGNPATLGAEDLTFATTDFDFNDMRWIQSGGEVPEPGTYALVGIGLIALAWRRRRGKTVSEPQ